jgi:predicted flap endonuclease-1-like 5' DNA nuclease
MRRILGERMCSLSRRQCWAVATGTLLLAPMAIILRGLRKARRLRQQRAADRMRANTTIDLTHLLHDEATEDVSSPAPNDLTRIKGIGPKMAAVLQRAGILTYEDLAQTELSRLEDILAREQLLSLSKPETWLEQSRLASRAAWEDLQTLQQRL